MLSLQFQPLHVIFSNILGSNRYVYNSPFSWCMLGWVCVVEIFHWSPMSHVVQSLYSCLISPSFLLNTTMLWGQGSWCSRFQTLHCPFQGYPKSFRSESGCTNHVCSVHPRANRHHVAAPDIQLPPLPTWSSPQLFNTNPFQEQSPQPPVGYPGASSTAHQSPSPKLQPQEPQWKTYHPFLNGKVSQVLSLLVTNALFQDVQEMKMGIIFPWELHCHPTLLLLLGTLSHLNMNFNSRSLISFTARKRCCRATSIIFLNSGHYHLWNMGALDLSTATNIFMTRLMQLKKVSLFSFGLISIYWI